jgi:hypothetical protein
MFLTPDTPIVPDEVIATMSQFQRQEWGAERYTIALTGQGQIYRVVRVADGLHFTITRAFVEADLQPLTTHLLMRFILEWFQRWEQRQEMRVRPIADEAPPIAAPAPAGGLRDWINVNVVNDNQANQQFPPEEDDNF